MKKDPEATVKEKRLATSWTWRSYQFDDAIDVCVLILLAIDTHAGFYLKQLAGAPKSNGN